MVIGVDIGGTKVLVASLDGRGINGESIRFETPQDPTLAIESIIKSIKQLPDWQQAESVVVGVPGLVDRRTRRLIACGNLHWENLHIAQIISNELNLPVYIENDANLAGLSEAIDHGFDKDTVLYLTVSTGIGSALIENSRLVEATSNSEAGQMMLKVGDEYQIWEKFASGHALYELYQQKAKDIYDDAIWYRISEALVPGMLVLLAIVQPDKIIIGGSIGTYFDRYDHHLIKALSDYNDSKMVRIPPIVGAKHAEEAVLRGCYDYAKSQN